MEELLSQITKSNETVQTILTNAQSNITDITANSEKSLKISQDSAAHLATTSQNDQNIAQIVASSRASNSEITTLENKIKEFFTYIDNYKKEILETKSTANSAVSKNKEDTENLVKGLKQLEDQIQEQIRRATGFTLFHSFQTRQAALWLSKMMWIGALGLLVIASVYLTNYIVTTTAVIGIAFYLKLSMSFPIIYAIAFCSIQYTRERKLEEEYAFKSNISISLDPYKKFVESMAGNTPEERAKFTSFIIDSINKVFSSPTKRIFDKTDSDMKPDAAIKQVGEILDSVIKPLSPLFKGK